MKNIIICFGLLTSMLSCNNSKVTQHKESKMSQYEVLYVAEYGGTGEEELRIIDNQGDFAMYWAEVTSQPALSAAKFDSNEKMVIVKSFQSRNSGGNTYEIDSVVHKGDQIQVYYSITSPSEMGTMAITNPLMILLVDKVAKPQVEFIKK
jgi:hypothetical protein